MKETKRRLSDRAHFKNKRESAKKICALAIAVLLMFSLCACSYHQKTHTEILESSAPSKADFAVLSVSQPETEIEGQFLRYVGLSGSSMVAIQGREQNRRIVLVGQSGYIKPCTEEMAILPDSVICRGTYVLFEAQGGEDRVDIFLLNLEDESVRKIGSYLIEELLAPVNWQDGDISFLVRNLSGAVFNRYHAQDHTLERVENVDIYRDISQVEVNNATLSRMFLTGDYIVCQLETGKQPRIVVQDFRDMAKGSIFSTPGSSAASAGGKLYYIDEDDALMSWKIGTNEKKKIWENVSFFVVSGDGSKLAVVEKGTAAYKLYIADAETDQALYVDIYQRIGRMYLGEDGGTLLVYSQAEQASSKGNYGGTYTFYEIGKQAN